MYVGPNVGQITFDSKFLQIDNTNLSRLWYVFIEPFSGGCYPNFGVVVTRKNVHVREVCSLRVSRNVALCMRSLNWPR